MCNEVKGPYDKIIITIVPGYNITIGMVTHAAYSLQTHDISGIALLRW